MPKVYCLYVDAQRSFACSDFHAQSPWYAGGRPAVDGARTAAFSFVAIRRGAHDPLGDVGSKFVGSSTARVGKEPLVVVVALPSCHKDKEMQWKALMRKCT
jgi:hypothetical protein